MQLECNAADVSGRLQPTAQGYRRFHCRACGNQFDERSGGTLNRAQYPSHVSRSRSSGILATSQACTNPPEVFLIRGIATVGANACCG